MIGGRIIRRARMGRMRITLHEFTFTDRGTEYAYQIRGGKISAGSFWTSSYTPEQLWQRAINCARSHAPRAILREA